MCFYMFQTRLYDLPVCNVSAALRAQLSKTFSMKLLRLVSRYPQYYLMNRNEKVQSIATQAAVDEFFKVSDRFDGGRNLGTSKQDQISQSQIQFPKYCMV